MADVDDLDDKDWLRIDNETINAPLSSALNDKPNPKLTSVELIHLRLTSMVSCNTLLPNVETLTLRDNEISKIEDLSGVTTLQKLDLYLNHISVIENLEGLPALTSLDLSFNEIRVIQGLDDVLPALTQLYFVHNKITSIGRGLLNCTGLTLLELGDNRLRNIEHLDTLVDLQELYLGKNKIAKIEGLESLTSLRILSLQSNRVTELEGLDSLVNLEELYLSDNGLTALQSLDCLTSLKILDAARNGLTAVENLSNLTLLEDLWVNGNEISQWNSIEKLSVNVNLQTVYLEGNPVSKDTQYRNRLPMFIPSLTQLDATPVNRSNPMIQ